MAVKDILVNAEAALEAAVTEPSVREQRRAMDRFMDAMGDLGREVAAGTTTWEALKPWARDHAERLRDALAAMNEWRSEMHLMGGDDESIESQLLMRSYAAFTRELFTGTGEAEEFLASYDSEESDQELREAAESYGLLAPMWAPPTHTWWKRNA